MTDFNTYGVGDFMKHQFMNIVGNFQAFAFDSFVLRDVKIFKIGLHNKCYAFVIAFVKNFVQQIITDLQFRIPSPNR
jgi:hypothetical protein